MTNQIPAQYSKSTISMDMFEGIAKEAVRRQPLRMQVQMSEIDLVDEEIVKWEGKNVALSPKAFKDYIEILKLPKAFLSRFEKDLGKENMQQFINGIKEHTGGVDGIGITVVFSAGEHQITAILTDKKKLISNQECITHIKETILAYNLDIVSFSISPEGDISVTTVSPDGFTQLPQLGPDEKFQSGISFNNTIRRGYEVHPYLLRLSCANGTEFRKVHGFKDTQQMHDLDDKVIKRFNEHMLVLQSSNFCPQTIHEKIGIAFETPASFAEMQHYANLLMTKSRVDWDSLQKWIPLQGVTNDFANKDVDTAKFSKAQAQNAKTNMTVWDLINAVTNFASHDHKVEIHDYNRNVLQIAAGDLLLKRMYDSQNTVEQVYG